MRHILALILFATLSGCGTGTSTSQQQQQSRAPTVRIAIGMSHTDAIAAIKAHSGQDIGPGLAVVGPKGEHPLRDVYWSFRDYDAVITISATAGKVFHMTYWTGKNFGESKEHRARTEQDITALVLNSKTKAVSIEKAR